MELPQSSSIRTTQATKATHDFLSLYTHPLQQDPRPSHEGFLKTHNFLIPLGEEKNAANEDKREDIIINKPLPTVSSPSIMEQQLPGRFGTYNISHMAYLNPQVAKLDDVITVASVTNNDINGENSNCSSYTGSGFTLWDESATEKGNIRNEITGAENVLKVSKAKVGQWPLDQPSQSSSNHRSSVSPFSSQGHMQKHQSFMEMFKSTNGPHSIAEDEEELNLRKESSSSHKGGLRVKIDGKNSSQKANTPRSKHSATEQRRRCKINDRFQMLRALIPHGDQKRDKASFLLEVIEYIQFLQEKVNRYEGSHSKCSSEPAELTTWGNGHGPAESLIHQSRVPTGVTSPMSILGSKHDEKPIQRNPNPQIPIESMMTNVTNFNTVDQQRIMTKKAVSNSSSLLPTHFSSARHNGVVHQSTSKLASDKEKGSLALLQSHKTGNLVSEPAPNQELALESGTISISSIYSQGLLSTLTKALQSSGVDLSHASISVQVDIGKRANNQQSQEHTDKVVEAPISKQFLLQARGENNSEQSDHAVKRFKTS